MQNATDHDNEDGNDQEHSLKWQDLARIAFAGVVLVAGQPEELASMLPALGVVLPSGSSSWA